jgi:four helix bundle protein
MRSCARMAKRIKSYRDLIAWQKAISERFGLSSQMRKAAVSVPSNIAEGSRHRRPGYISRVIIALGEHAELETQALLSDRRGYIQKADMDTFNALSAEVGELTHGLLRSLEALS